MFFQTVTCRWAILTCLLITISCHEQSQHSFHEFCRVNGSNEDLKLELFPDIPIFTDEGAHASICGRVHVPIVDYTGYL